MSPEPAKRRGAHVRGQASPQQLVVQLLVGADEKGLDERRIALDEHDAIRRDRSGTGQHQLGKSFRERLAHRTRESWRELASRNRRRIDRRHRRWNLAHRLTHDRGLKNDGIDETLSKLGRDRRASAGRAS